MRLNKKLVAILALAGVCLGAGIIPSNSLKIGDGAASNKFIYLDRGGSNPTIKWNESASTLQFSNDGVNFQSIGSGAGGINYIAAVNSDGTSTTGYATYKDAAGTTPVDGIGGSPTHITFSASASSPLRGNSSFLITNSGSSSAQGEGVSYDFTIDASDKAKVLSISFDHILNSGTFQAGIDPNVQDSDLEVYIYDVTNSQLLQPTPYKLFCNSSSLPCSYQGTFQTNSNSTSYRLIFHVPTTNTSAWALKVDNIVVGPQVARSVTPVTDWTSFTPVWTATSSNPTLGSKAVEQALWRRVGSHMEVYYNLRINGSGSAGSGTYLFALPSGYSVSSSLNSDGNNSTNAVGIAKITDGSSGGGEATVAVYDSTHLDFLAATATFKHTSASNFGGAATTVSFTATFPITGWSSSVTTSSDSDTRVLSTSAYRSSTQNISSGADTKVQINAVSYDTHGLADTSTNFRITVPLPGKYVILAAVGYQANATGSRHARVKVNGTLVYDAIAMAAASPNATTVSTGKALDLKAGDYVELWASQDSGGTLTTGGGPEDTYLTVTRVTGPALIAPTESINVKYRNSAATSIANGAASAVPFVTKVYDTHGSFATSTFTAPIKGKYALKSAIVFDTATFTAGAVITMFAVRNGSQTDTIGRLVVAATGSQNANVSGSTTIDLNAGDTLQIFLGHGESGARTLLADGQYNFVTIDRVGN